MLLPSLSEGSWTLNLITTLSLITTRAHILTWALRLLTSYLGLELDNICCALHILTISMFGLSSVS